MTKQEIRAQAERTMEKLRLNGMDAVWADTRADAAALVAQLLRPGDVIGLGGSVTLTECGILELVRRPEYKLVDRYAPGLTREQVQDCYHRALNADVFLCSSNAITETGELYNVDGNSNRVAALMYGPKKVIVIAGYQKIVPDVAAAVERVRTVAAPKNAQRLNCATYCASEGHCIACGKEMGIGCTSPQRICRNFVVSASQMNKGRIQVILVGEQLGY